MSTMEPVETETITVTSNSRIYLEALESYGLLEGDTGQLSPGVWDVLHGLHQVLGGGVVSVEVRSDGTSSVVGELDTALQNAMNTFSGALRDAGIHCP
jgi:hypothetical protein